MCTTASFAFTTYAVKDVDASELEEEEMLQEEIETTKTETTFQYHTQVISTTEATTAPTPAPSSEIDPPFVQITRGEMSKKPKAGEEFTISVILSNYSDQVALTDGAVTIEPGEGLVLCEKSSSFALGNLKRNGVRTMNIRLRVKENVEDSNQSVDVTYAYNYRTPEELQQAEKKEKLMIPVIPSESSGKSSNATPNIIVTNYSYGGTIAAGDEFNLALKFKNTSSKVPVENIIMSLDAGENVSITSASNTYYFTKLSPNAELTQTIPMRISSNATAGGARISISFHYEYVDNGTRSGSDSNESLSIPVYVPDRFEVTPPETNPIGIQNQEIGVSIAYVNKSKSSVDNVQAKLIYDKDTIMCEQDFQIIGNIAAGNNGTIDFYFIPMESGEGSVKVQVTYENELVEEKKLEFEISYSADPEMPMDFGDYPTEEFTEEPSHTKTIILISSIAAALIILTVVIIVVVKKRKKKAVELSPEFDWNLPTTPAEENNHENQ